VRDQFLRVLRPALVSHTFVRFGPRQRQNYAKLRQTPAPGRLHELYPALIHESPLCPWDEKPPSDLLLG
jgi:hypothetical protein